MSTVRVRFAPSPTGYVHVGNARTALFNWLFARRHGGVFVLRIEDTDIERSEARYETQLLEDLRWFGLDWDEGPDKPEGGGPFGPYRQSERKELYARYAAQLIDAGHAYHCFCSAEQLEAERQADLKAGRQPKYSGRCRKLRREEAEKRRAAGELASARLKIEASAFTWRDLVHGPTTFSSEVIGDPILVRSDGHPAYNYAVVIDDHLMAITHVIRGDDHISNTPRQLALYQALDWNPPAFAHLSTILGPDRTRLSKRHGATSLESFRNLGILPEALCNYLALLGWSPTAARERLLSQTGPRPTMFGRVAEVFTMNEMSSQFSLDHVNKNPAVFDDEKLYSLNRHYLMHSQLPRLAELSLPILVSAGLVRERASSKVMGWLENVLDAVRKNIDHLSQLPEATRIVFEYDAAKVVAGEETRHVAEEAAPRDVLASFIPKVLAEADLTYERFREIAKSVQKGTGKKGKDLFHPIRVAVTGAVSGPELEKLIPIFEEGAKLRLARPIKSTAQRLREFAAAAKLGGNVGDA